MAKSRQENEELHQHLLQLQRETQLAALEALQEAQTKNPAATVIDPNLLDSLIDRLTNLVESDKKKGKK